MLEDSCPDGTWYQFRVHRQNAFLYGQSCGYYALHNASCVVAALVEPNPQDWLHCLTSEVAFLSVHQGMYNALVSATQTRNSGQFTKVSLENAEGELTRTYMAYLLANYAQLQHFGGKQYFSSVPSLSLREMANGIMTQAEMHSIQAIFDEFARRPSFHHAFLVGSGDHWISVVVNKFQGEYEVILMDSYNSRCMMADDAELRAYAHRLVIESRQSDLLKYRQRKAFSHMTDEELLRIIEFGYGRRWTDEHVKSEAERLEDFFQSLKDRRFAMCLFGDLVSQKTTMRKTYMHVLVNRVCGLLRLPMDTQQGPEHVTIEEWLDNPSKTFLPAQINAGLLQDMWQLGHGHLSPELKEKLCRWATKVQARVRGLQNALTKQLASPPHTEETSQRAQRHAHDLKKLYLMATQILEFGTHDGT